MKTPALFLFAALSAFPLTGFTQVNFNNAGGDLLYQNPNNWVGGAVPVGTVSPVIGGTYNVTFSSSDTYTTTGITRESGRLLSAMAQGRRRR